MHESDQTQIFADGLCPRLSAFISATIRYYSHVPIRYGYFIGIPP